MNHKNYDQERNNPCLKEHKMSMECLNKNDYSKDKCEAYFANYNTCKEFWNNIRSARRAKGIYPYLPEPEERDQIKSEYMKRRTSTQ